jgi:hypothetical protein
MLLLSLLGDGGGLDSFLLLRARYSFLVWGLLQFLTLLLVVLCAVIWWAAGGAPCRVSNKGRRSREEDPTVPMMYSLGPVAVASGSKSDEFAGKKPKNEERPGFLAGPTYCNLLEQSTFHSAHGLVLHVRQDVAVSVHRLDDRGVSEHLLDQGAANVSSAALKAF